MAAIEGCYVASPYWELPDAETSYVVTQHYRPLYWNLGKVGGTVYFTGDTSSTNTIFFTVRLSAFVVDGTALTTAAGDLTATSNIKDPGPAVADELQTFDIPPSGWLPLTATYPYISVTIGRNGSDGDDTYAGNARILGVMLRFYPTRR